jgi:hypothetical protein
MLVFGRVCGPPVSAKEKARLAEAAAVVLAKIVTPVVHCDSLAGLDALLRDDLHFAAIVLQL